METGNIDISQTLSMSISLVQLIINLSLAIFAFKTLVNGKETMERQKSKDYEEEKRRNYYEEKKQAININSWIEESDQNSDETTNKELTVFAVLQNNSNQCAYNVCFMLRKREEVVKQMKKQKCKEFNKVFKGIIGEPTKIRYLPTHKEIRIELK